MEEPMKKTTQTVIDALQNVVCNPEHSEHDIALYFDPAYQQVVDGHRLDYREFIEHMALLKSHTTQINVSVLSAVTEDQTVFTHHHVKAAKIQGEHCEFEVFARFTLSSGKIIRCDELTRMIHGTSGDRDLGGRH
jgi:hypothetical protein